MRQVKICGRPRKYTDAQVAAIQRWKPLATLCREIGVPPASAKHIRTWNYKKPSP